MHILSSILETPISVLAERADEIECFVIGSGTAGITTAVELARAGLGPVAVLEAGPFVMTQHVGSSPFGRRPDIVPAIHDLVRYETSWVDSGTAHQAAGGKTPGNNTAWSAVGGRTLFWGGCTPRFDPWDFHDWPFTYEDFLPYYERAEQLMGVSGTRQSHPAFCQGYDQDLAIMRLNQAGIPARRAPLGVDTETMINGKISRGFDSSVDRLLRSGHLLRLDGEGGKRGICLTPEAVVTRLHQQGDRVTSMDLLDRPSGKSYEIPVRRVVLAGGAIQSTRLALSSRLDGGNGLVGRHINDHLFIQGLLKLARPPRDAAFYVLVMPTPKTPFQVQIQGCFRETWYSPYHSTVWLDSHQDGVYILFYCFGSGSVEGDNRLELLTPDPSCGGMRDYRVIYDRSPKDLELLEQMSDTMPRVAEALGAEIVRQQVNLPGSALHEIGGLRMGTDPATSVTDPWGVFHHLKNLSVADSSTFPYQGPANSYLSITAWSLRHAEGLRRRMLAEKQDS